MAFWSPRLILNNCLAGPVKYYYYISGKDILFEKMSILGGQPGFSFLDTAKNLNLRTTNLFQ